MTVAERIRELGLELPAAPKPVASYVSHVRSGNLVFVSGIVPNADGKPLVRGLVGESVSVDAAQDAARHAALQAIALLMDADLLEHVRRVVRVTGYVASAPGFTAQPSVINGASDLLVRVFQDAGKHARSAVGVAALPLDSSVEVEFIFEVE